MIAATSSSSATADAVAAVIDSLVALILGVLSFMSASRTTGRTRARRARRAPPETVTLPVGPALADPADVPALSWPGIYVQVTGLYERLLAYVEQETARLRARLAELETQPEEGPRMPVPRPPGHERRAERRAGRRRVQPGDAFTAEEEVDLVDVEPDPEGAEPAADAEPEIPEDAEEVH